MANQSRLDILIAAKNTASGALKAVTSDLQNLDRVAGIAAKGLAGLGAAAGVAGIVAVTGAIADLSREAAGSERIGDSFEQLAQKAGSSADAMLAAMKRASRGTIDESQLMLQANQAILTGAAQSADDLVKMLEIAGARGKATGRSMSEAFADISVGVSRESKLILDNLGIVLDVAKVNEEYARSLGVSADQLTDAERKQALLNAAYEQSRDLIDANAKSGRDLAGEFERMDASISNARSALGALFSPAAAAVAKLIADGAESAAEAMIGMAEAGEKNRAAFDLEVARKNVEGITEALRTLEREGRTDTQAYTANLKALAEAEAVLTAATQRATALQIQQSGILERLSGLRAGEAEETYAMERASRMSEATARAEAAAMEELRDAVDKLNAARNRMMGNIAATARGIALNAADVIGAEAAFGLYQDINKQLVEYRNQLHMAGRSEEEVLFLVEARGQALRDEYGKLYDVTQQTKAYSAAAKEVNRAFEDLRSKVEGVLSQALSLDVGVNPGGILEELGFRPDAINEDARRLADVAVKGWESPWVDYFRTKFPALWAQYFSGAMDGGNIKAQAAQLLKNFEDGLQPELIDRGRAKERIVRMILGEANMGALAQELASEIASEMGISLGQAQAATRAALGVSDQGGVGADAATAFDNGLLAGLAQTNSGHTFMSQLASQMRASDRLITAEGTNAGARFVDGFMAASSSLPASFLEMLASMVTPHVETVLNRRSTLTGAVN